MSRKMSEIFVAFCQKFSFCCDELLPATATTMIVEEEADSSGMFTRYS